MDCTKEILISGTIKVPKIGCIWLSRPLSRLGQPCEHDGARCSIGSKKNQIKFGFSLDFHYLCNLLLLIIGAFGRQSSMRCVAIISRPVSSLFGDGVTLRSGLYRVDKCKNMVHSSSIDINTIIRSICQVDSFLF